MWEGETVSGRDFLFGERGAVWTGGAGTVVRRPQAHRGVSEQCIAMPQRRGAFTWTAGAVAAPTVVVDAGGRRRERRLRWRHAAACGYWSLPPGGAGARLPARLAGSLPAPGGWCHRNCWAVSAARGAASA